MSDKRATLQLQELYSVKDAICVVTGGASGLGLTISQTLVQNLAKKLYITSRNVNQLKEAQKYLQSLNNNCVVECIPSNLSTKSGVDTVVDYVKARENQLDILVNNSGVTWGAKLEDFPEQAGFDNVMALNVKASFYMIAGLASLLAEGKTNTAPAHVVNISSIAGLATTAQNGGLTGGGVGVWSYNASKAALNSLTKTLAQTLSRRNIMVNAILPGVFETRMTRYGLDKYKDKILSSQPTGRYGEGPDLAATLLFLVSKGSAHVTGNLIVLDGGSTL
ncbi:NAD(P)-binding protein [Wallemia mellicola CBS 633.66]|uniref:NAD(P)-binding protein n=1 Tax=Wallemia mellicola (strain ATCC MYA-4683 / CBS 633.66) TaxID=671144 RepID=I4YBE8_WALMC|nr:NAD(P)-binding protein [Wallemia mellicola CBS 633.66]EIM21290.1 NAD(P)-binding protein [Wallemia mellicola CBS 633.66]|eukprot:XP_006958643.1 NAD(P)-binding protein [Wallemia mellicola CBS 633.66]